MQLLRELLGNRYRRNDDRGQVGEVEEVSKFYVLDRSDITRLHVHVESKRLKLPAAKPALNRKADAALRPLALNRAPTADRELEVVAEVSCSSLLDHRLETAGILPPSRVDVDRGASARRDLYNLYHVLNHLNLFGGSYRAQAERMIERLLAGIR